MKSKLMLYFQMYVHLHLKYMGKKALLPRRIPEELLYCRFLRNSTVLQTATVFILTQYLTAHPNLTREVTFVLKLTRVRRLCLQPTATRSFSILWISRKRHFRILLKMIPNAAMSIVQQKGFRRAAVPLMTEHTSALTYRSQI